MDLLCRSALRHEEDQSGFHVVRHPSRRLAREYGQSGNTEEISETVEVL
jgi:hypothetical protein